MGIKHIKSKMWLLDAVGMLCVLAGVFAVLLHVYTSELRICYPDATGAKQFMYAMQIARGNFGEGVSIIAYVEAFFLRIAMIFMPVADLYRVFIVIEMGLRIVEILLFYWIVRNMGKGVLAQLATPVISILYFMGYPAISVLRGNYDYWNGNAIIVLFFLAIIQITERKCWEREFTFGKKKISGRLIVAIATGIFFLGYYVIFWRQTHVNELDQTETMGMFRNIYGDFIFFVPVLVFLVAQFGIKKRGSAALTVAGIAVTIAAVFLYVQWNLGNMDAYYYYLNHYCLWTAGWIMTAAAVHVAIEAKEVPALLSYAGMCCILLLLSVGGFDRYMWNYAPNYNNAYSTTNFFAIYRHTADRLMMDYMQYEYDATILKEFSRVTEGVNKDNEKTAILTADEATQYWYDGVTGAVSEEFRTDKEEFPDIIMNLEQRGIDVLVAAQDFNAINADITFYEDYFKECDVLQTNRLVFYSPPNIGWTDIVAVNEEYNSDKKELFTMTAKGSEYEGAPLMADKASYLDFIMYQDITGRSMKDYYTWHYSPVDNIKNLNRRGKRYIVVLYDDLYYQETKPYFDQQIVVYSNTAGCILTYSGDTWATSY